MDNSDLYRRLLTERLDKSLRDKIDGMSERERQRYVRDLARDSISGQVGRSLRSTFSQKAAPLFDLYGRLRLAAAGIHGIERDYINKAERAIDIVAKVVNSTFVESEVIQTGAMVITRTRKVAKNGVDSKDTKRAARDAAEDLADVIRLAGQDAGIGISFGRDPDGVKGFVKLVKSRSDTTISEGEQEKIQEGINDNFSNSIYRMLRKRFRPNSMPFFEMYARLRMFHDGLKSITEKQVEEFLIAIRALRKKVDDDFLRVELREKSMEYRKTFRKLLRDLPTGKRKKLSRRIGMDLLEFIEEVAYRHDIFIKRKKKFGSRYWFKLNKMRPSPEKMRKMEDEAPEHYKLAQKQKEMYDILDQEIRGEIESDGLIPERKMIMGRLVHVGVSPESKGEGTEEEAYVYDTDGEKKKIDQWIEDRKEKLNSLNKLYDGTIFRTLTEVDEMRTVEEDDFDKIQEKVEAGEVTWEAITDDKTKSNALTKTFPTVEVDGKKVIAGFVEEDDEGEKKFRPNRYTGVTLDDMVNKSGRLIEGSAFFFENGRRHSVKTLDEHPDFVNEINEPYVTVAENGRLYISVPSHRSVSAASKGLKGRIGKTFTRARNRMRKLTKSPWVDEIGKGKTTYEFDPEAYPEVMRALGSFSMSLKASEKIKQHYRDRKNSDEVTARAEYENLQLDNLGGFKSTIPVEKPDGSVEDREVQLNSAQLKALAHLDANGNKGIAALDTGVGKSLSSIAYMKKLERDGEFGPDDKVLFVAPSKLLGNIVKEAEKFLRNPDDLVDRMDIMSYRDFQGVWKDTPDGYFKEEYVAIIFDEAGDKLTSVSNPGGSNTAKGAMEEHPRKVMLTASPMEKSPVEAYTLVAMVNNKRIDKGPERKKMFKFLKDNCERLGGRYVSISNDPEKAENFKAWVKDNIFYTDKTDVEGYELPELKKETMTVEMPEDVEKRYKAALRGMYSMIKKYKKRFDKIEDGTYEVYDYSKQDHVPIGNLPEERQERRKKSL